MNDGLLSQNNEKTIESVKWYFYIDYQIILSINLNQ